MSDYRVGQWFSWRKQHGNHYSVVDCVIKEILPSRQIKYELHRTRVDGHEDIRQLATMTATEFESAWAPRRLSMTGGLDYLSAINDCQEA